MNTPQAVQKAMDMSNFVLDAYFSDLTDAELLTRPGAGCNHLAWQLGHLISSQADLLEGIAPGSGPSMPNGFRERHSTEHAGSNDPAQFCTKAEYVELSGAVRDAAKAALAEMSDDDFDKPGPEAFRRRFPTVGDIWILIATHPMMHAGQFVPVRRMLGKPVKI